MGRGVLQAEHDAAHQRRHRRVKTLDLKPFDAAGLGRATGIVEQAIDTAESLDRLPDQRAHLRLNCDVGLTKDAGRAEFSRQCLTFRRAASGDDDFCAFGDEDFGGPQPNAARRAGDNRNLALKPPHVALLFPGDVLLCNSSLPEQSKQGLVA